MVTTNTSFPLVVTSSLDTDGCDYRWALTRIFNLRQEYKYDRNLNFGAAFADAIYAARKGFYIDKLSFSESKEEAYNIVDTVFTLEFMKDKEDRERRGISPEKIKTPDRLTELIDRYFNKFPLLKETIAPFLLDGSLSAEQALYLPLIEDVKIAVKPDLLAIDSVYNSTTIIDEKTIGNLSQETRWNEYMYMLRQQFNLYARTLQLLQESGLLPVPPIKTFEVRRAILSPSVSSAGDTCNYVTFSVDDKKIVKDSFKEFTNLINSRLESWIKLLQANPEVEQTSVYGLIPAIEKFFSKDYSICYQYAKLCPLAKHCARQNSLFSEGFKVSKIDTVTKEVVFLN